MNIFLIYVGDFMKCPPALSLSNILKMIGTNITLITLNIDSETVSHLNKEGIQVYNLNYSLEDKGNIFKRGLKKRLIRRIIWKIIDQSNVPLTLWIISDTTLKYLGKRLLNYPYILHFLELSDKVLPYAKCPFIKFNMNKYCERALQVVQAEYNRAHICKAIWHLSKLPIVLPNKPFIDDKMLAVPPSNIAKRIEEVLAQIGTKKVILYQGILSPERPMEEFIKAVTSLGNDYVFLIMSSDENCYAYLNCKNYIYVPFIKPPYHLLITQRAYIGVLSYVPTQNSYSPLNALYCAPNKIYEYSKFGVPMLGNDIPGLSYLFGTAQCGIAIELLADNIISAIRALELNYNYFSDNSTRFYNTCNMPAIVSSIIESCSDVK